jgi:ribonuclease HI
MATQKLTLYTDGAARRNPGPAAIGVVIKNGGRTVATISQAIGQATNNQAEYRAVIAGLERALELGAGEVEVRADSQLVVQQLAGAFRVKEASLKPLYQQAQALCNRFANCLVSYIPREENQEADRLANQAFSVKAPRSDSKTIINVRPATHRDYKALFAIYAEIEAQHARALPQVFKSISPQMRAPYLGSILGSPDAVLLVAELEGRVAGLIQLSVREIADMPIMVSRRYVKISDLCVAEDCQRRGVGSALMEAAEAWGKKHNAANIELMVWEFNKDAQAFYKKTGYRTVSRNLWKDIE